MTNAAIVKAFEVVQRHGSAMWAELQDVLTEASATTDPSMAAASSDTAASSRSWAEIDRYTNQTYSWPPDAGGTEEYEPFIVYQSGSRILALAHNVSEVWVKDKPRKQIWVFRLGAGRGSKEPITPFIAADDYSQTREMVAIIRGKGETGRKMFGPGDDLPPAYDDLKIEVLGERVEGHYNKYAVVAHEDDIESMLRHGAEQLRLRGM